MRKHLITDFVRAMDKETREVLKVKRKGKVVQITPQSLRKLFELPQNNVTKPYLAGNEKEWTNDLRVITN